MRENQELAQNKKTPVKLSQRLNLSWVIQSVMEWFCSIKFQGQGHLPLSQIAPTWLWALPGMGKLLWASRALRISNENKSCNVFLKRDEEAQVPNALPRASSCSPNSLLEPLSLGTATLESGKCFYSVHGDLVHLFRDYCSPFRTWLCSGISIIHTAGKCLKNKQRTGKVLNELKMLLIPLLLL